MNAKKKDHLSSKRMQLNVPFSMKNAEAWSPVGSLPTRDPAESGSQWIFPGGTSAYGTPVSVDH